MSQLKLYNSLTRKKEIFQPLEPSHVGLYVCGPTVYDFAHIGNARPVVVIDILVRLLRYLYPKVTYVRNITDVDDKINAASQQSGKPISEITTRTTKAYHEDMAALGSLPPDIEPRATANISEMIAMIESLIVKGFAYVAEGHVLFQVNKFSAYGTLSRRQVDEMLAGARIEVAPYKKEPGDFILWKPSTADQPGWESPWGRGRPGWHIECSAMSNKYLGQTFDIHGGGIDLIFPHHENEVAQSCCANGTERLANYWLHNGHVTVNGEKMSKSLGNFFTVHDLRQTYPGEVLRLVLISSHYRQPLDWSEGSVQQAKQTLDRLYNALRGSTVENSTAEIDTLVLEALLDDINVPLALSRLHELVSEVNKAENPSEKNHKAAILKRSASFLGLIQQDANSWFRQDITLDSQRIESLIEKRKNARLNHDFAEADRVRQELLDNGIILEDSPQGTTWRRI